MIKYTYGEDNDGWYVAVGDEQVCWCMDQKTAEKVCSLLNSYLEVEV